MVGRERAREEGGREGGMEGGRERVEGGWGVVLALPGFALASALAPALALGPCLVFFCLVLSSVLSASSYVLCHLSFVLCLVLVRLGLALALAMALALCPTTVAFVDHKGCSVQCGQLVARMYHATRIEVLVK